MKKFLCSTLGAEDVIYIHNIFINEDGENYPYLAVKGIWEYDSSTGSWYDSWKDFEATPTCSFPTFEDAFQYLSHCYEYDDEDILTDVLDLNDWNVTVVTEENKDEFFCGHIYQFPILKLEWKG